VEWLTNRYALPGLGVHSFVEMDWAWPTDPFDTYSTKNANPFVHIYGMVTRQQIQRDGNICMPDPVLMRNPIKLEKALEMFTLEPAYAVSQEDVLGSLKPGKYADMIILSDNPLTIDINKLIDVKVLMTMVGGQVEYCAAGNSELCPFYSQPENQDIITPTPTPEPITLSIIKKQSNVPSGTPVELSLGWEAATKQQVTDFLDSAQLEITLDGEPLKNTGDYWGEIKPNGDRFGSQWLYPIGVLDPGKHQVEIVLSVSKPVLDGLGNTYSGTILQNTLQVDVGN